MQRIEFCSRCRGMKVGWNSQYMIHRLVCTKIRVPSLKVLLWTVSLVLIFAFPTQSPVVYSGDSLESPVGPRPQPKAAAETTDPDVGSIESFLKGHGVNGSHLSRVAGSIVESARRHDVAPRLIASIVIVESRANPFAISQHDSVGIMQIHLPTWGSKADREGVNLLKIEDNIDFGTRILKDYIRQFGLWGGVKRYKGWISTDPTSESSAIDYMAKVQRNYGFTPPASPAAEPDLQP